MATTPYIDTTEAQTYFDERLNTDAWDSATTTNKEKALKQATRIINGINFVGEKTDSSQANQFPRNDDTSVPQDIKDACAEIALALLNGSDIELEFENLFMESTRYDGVSSSFDRTEKQEHIRAGVPSITAWRLLKPYVRDPESIRINRIS